MPTNSGLRLIDLDSNTYLCDRCAIPHETRDGDFLCTLGRHVEGIPDILKPTYRRAFECPHFRQMDPKDERRGH